MDRNCEGVFLLRKITIVALRKESVDRNFGHCLGSRVSEVALRKESVDRNRTPHQRNTKPIPSLSARRAWIEIRVSETL